MNKHLKGFLLLLLGLFLMPFIVHFIQLSLVDAEHQFTQVQSIYVGWFIIGGVVLFNTLRSWLE